jgi:hypothetical protein
MMLGQRSFLTPLPPTILLPKPRIGTFVDLEPVCADAEGHFWNSFKGESFNGPEKIRVADLRGKFLKVWGVQKNNGAIKSWIGLSRPLAGFIFVKLGMSDLQEEYSVPRSIKGESPLIVSRAINPLPVNVKELKEINAGDFPQLLLKSIVESLPDPSIVDRKNFLWNISKYSETITNSGYSFMPLYRDFTADN